MAAPGPDAPVTYDFSASLDEAERTVKGVRSQLDRAWDSFYRGTGLVYLSVGLALTVAWLETLTTSSLDGARSTGVVALDFAAPLLFVGLGLWYHFGYPRFHRPHRSNRQWFRRAFLREPIPDSRVADVLDHLRTMRREIQSLETAWSLLAALLIVALLGLALLGSYSSYQLVHMPSSGPASPGVRLGTAAGGFAAAAAVAGLLWWGRAYLRPGRELEAGLRGAEARLAGVESSFWGRF